MSIKKREDASHLGVRDRRAMPFVSVIVPVYNVESYLSQCVKSITSQSYKHLEILLIDDGSTDSSGDICEKLAESDSRIKVFHKKNEGLGLTRNFGLKKCHGDYVTFIDSDDYYIDIDDIEKLVSPLLADDDYQIVIGGFRRVDNSGAIIFEETYEEQTFSGDDVKNKLLPRMIGSLPDRKDSIFTSVNGKLYSLKMIRDHNIKFHSERELQSEDLVFQLDFMPKCRSAYIGKTAIYCYRVNMGSLTGKYKAKRFEEALKVYKYVCKKCEELELGDEGILRAKKMFFVQAKVCLRQERHSISGLLKKTIKNNIRKIVNNNELQEAIADYPVAKLSLKQKVFVKAISGKHVMLLYLLMENGLC